MTIQYIDFSTKPGYATIWDTKDHAPADAIAVPIEDLRRFVETTEFTLPEVTASLSEAEHNHALVLAIDEATQSAYMYDSYEREEWYEAIRGLLIMGLDTVEVQAVLFSKVPRWADDNGPRHRDIAMWFNDNYTGVARAKFLADIVRGMDLKEIVV